MTEDTAERLARRMGATFTKENIDVASAEVERLSHELDITNADHIALWLEANMQDSPLAWLACRIIEAHEQAEHPARLEGVAMGIAAAAKVAGQRRNIVLGGLSIKATYAVLDALPAAIRALDPRAILAEPEAGA